MPSSVAGDGADRILMLRRHQIVEEVFEFGLRGIGFDSAMPVFAIIDDKADLGSSARDQALATLQTPGMMPSLLPMAPGMSCRTGFLSLQHFQQRDK